VEWFFLESFKGEILSRNKVQLLDLASWLWLAIIKFPFMRIVWDHYDFMLKHSKPCLSSSSRNYSWFMQYMNSDNRALCNVRPPLGMHSESFHLISIYIYDVNYYVIIWFHFLYWVLFVVACDFCSQSCNGVCSFEREKTMFTTKILILRWCGFSCIFDHGPSQKF